MELKSSIILPSSDHLDFIVKLNDFCNSNGAVLSSNIIIKEHNDKLPVYVLYYKIFNISIPENLSNSQKAIYFSDKIKSNSNILTMAFESVLEFDLPSKIKRYEVAEKCYMKLHKDSILLIKNKIDDAFSIWKAENAELLKDIPRVKITDVYKYFYSLVLKME